VTGVLSALTIHSFFESILTCIVIGFSHLFGAIYKHKFIFEVLIMAYLDLLLLQQFSLKHQAEDACQQARRKLPGFYELQQGRALSLQAREASLLRVGQGGLWLTSSRQTGDHFLRPGEQWQAEKGEFLVIEPWQTQLGRSARFAWDVV
jgi:hypothetical protein